MLSINKCYHRPSSGKTKPYPLLMEPDPIICHIEGTGQSQSKTTPNKNARANYYVEKSFIKNTPSGRYYGEGAKALGLQNQPIYFNDPTLAQLLDGKLPDGKTALRRGVGTVRHYKNRKNPSTSVSHCDFTFSVSKGVSLLTGISPLPIQKKLVQLMTETNEELNQHISKHCESRLKAGGKNREVSKPIIATFFHSTSRDGDPQFHFHNNLINGALCSDGKWRAIDNDAFFKKDEGFRYEAGQLAINSLRKKLETELKLKTYDIPFSEGKGVSFGICGIPPTLLRHFSKRSEKIDEETTPEMSGKERKQVVTDTRPHKKRITNPQATMNEWQRQAQELFNFSWEDVLKPEVIEKIYAEYGFSPPELSKREVKAEKLQAKVNKPQSQAPKAGKIATPKPESPLDEKLLTNQPLNTEPGEFKNNADRNFDSAPAELSTPPAANSTEPNTPQSQPKLEPQLGKPQALERKERQSLSSPSTNPATPTTDDEIITEQLFKTEYFEFENDTDSGFYFSTPEETPEPPAHLTDPTIPLTEYTEFQSDSGFAFSAPELSSEPPKAWQANSPPLEPDPLLPVYTKMAEHLEQHHGGVAHHTSVFRAATIYSRNGFHDFDNIKKISRSFSNRYVSNENLNEAGKSLINYEGLREKLQANFKRLSNFIATIDDDYIEQKKKALKCTLLYATGKITRKQYLLGKEWQKMARLRFEGKITRKQYDCYLETLRSDLKIPKSTWMISIRSCFGTTKKGVSYFKKISEKQARYWQSYSERIGDKHPEKLSRRERKRMNKLKPTWKKDPINLEQRTVKDGLKTVGKAVAKETVKASVKVGVKVGVKVTKKMTKEVIKEVQKAGRQVRKSSYSQRM